MIRKEELFQIGYFSKPHGIKGELTLITDYNLFDGAESYVVCEMNGILVPFYIETYRFKGSSSILMKLENVDDEISAKKFANQEVYYPLKMMKEDSTKEFSWKHFVGYILEDEKLGILGIVKDVDDVTLNILFQIDYNGRELLVPIAEELICSIDQAERKLLVLLPEGIMDL